MTDLGDILDLDQAMLELARLRHRHEAGARHRERLLERVAWFPNEVNQRDLAQVEAEQQAMEARMRELEELVDSSS